MKNKLILFLLVFFSLVLKAQNPLEPCAFDEINPYIDSVHSEKRLANLKWLQYWRNTHTPNHLEQPSGLEQRADCRKAKIIIPIWFHVIHQGGAENINQAQIDNAIEKMNLHYANALSSTLPAAVNTGYQFVLGGITKVNSSLANHKKLTETAQLMALSMRGADTFINVWVVKEIQTSSGGSSDVQGYATYPGTIYGAKGQGIVMRYDWLGNFSSYGSPVIQYSEGKVLSHEVGHYLGLLHPFTDSCSGMYNNNCDIQGDLCCDVPPVSNPYQSCTGTYNTCNEFYGGDKDDQKANYMDYSNPECKNTFTADQTVLMDAITAKHHPTLGSPLYFPVNLTDCIVSAKMDGTTAACKGEFINIQTYQLTGNTYSWKLYKNGTLVHSSTGSHTYTYNPDTGKYTLELTVTNTGKVAVQTLDDIEIFDCSKLLPTTKGNWVFAQNAGLRFTPNKSIPDFEPFNKRFPTQVNASEGTATISNSLGNLLLYAGQGTGKTEVKNRSLRIFGKNHKEIQGSPSDSINGSAMHGVLFVPMPDSVGKYLLFYTPLNTYDIYFHVIDAKHKGINSFGDSAFGKITRHSDFVSVPSTLFPSPNFNHNLSAIPKCKPTDYWLLSHDASSGRIAVISVTGDSIAYHSSFATGITTQDNSIAFNLQGTFFHFEKSIYAFDRVTGQITLFKTLSPTGFHSTWGSMWSPSGRLLYRSELINENNIGKFYIYQYNVESSATLLNRSLVTESATDRSMQLGPDGKIYIAVDGNYLSQIEHPNNAILNNANECEYTHVGVPLKVGSTGGNGNANSLPNLINAEKEELDKSKSSFYVRVSNCTSIAVEPEIKCAASFEWIWGDGTSNTTGMNSTHNYSSTGTFSVKLILGGTDTVEREITLGLAPGAKTISGNTYICDTTLLAEYNVPQHTHRNLVWSATGANSFGSDKNIAEAFWKESGTVKVIVTDEKGCTDSSTVFITVPTPIRNNHIDSNQVVCSSSQIQDLTGSLPEGGNGSFTYQWSVRPKDGTYRILSGATGQNHVPYKNDSSYYYVRTVQSGSCISQSTAIQICNISDLTNITFIRSGCDRVLRPEDTTFTTAGYTIQWQVSTDSTNYTDISGATQSNLSIPFSYQTPSINADKFYNPPIKKWYRRKLITSNCTIVSNSIGLLPDVYVKGNYQAIPLCAPSNYKVEYEVVNNTFYPLTYSWDIYSTEIIKLYSTNTSAPVISINTGQLTKTGKAQLKISNSWCAGSIYLTANANDKGTRSMPLGIDTALGVWTDLGGTLQFNSEVRKHSHSAFYGWEKSTNQGATWTFYSSNENITITNIQFNEDYDWYRPYGYNYCFYDYDPNTSDPHSGNEYGIIHAVRVRNPKGQYWIKDSRNDIGDEPNTPDISNYTHSYDLWVRQRSNYGTRVWDYMDQSGLKADEDTNFMHVMIHNYGDSPTTGGKLYLYWTVNSTNESWPDKWMGVDYKDTFYNADLGKIFPRSGRINKVGIDIGTIAPSDSVMRTYPWVQADTVPKPEWYYLDSAGQHSYSNIIGVCYLARIETADNYPHQMTNPEYRFKEITIQHNVVWNRKVASNNFFLDYVNPPFSKQIQGWTFFYVKPKTGLLPRDVKFKMHVSDPAYYTNCEVLMHLSDHMWDEMAGLGFPGTGFTVDLGSRALIITQNDAIIGNFSCDPDVQSGVAFTFREKLGGSGGSATTPYLFTLSQYVEDTIHLGNMQYGLYGPADDEGEGGPLGAPFSNEASQGTNNLSILKADPNPFTGELHIQYQGGLNQKVQLQLFDMEGQLVKEICNCQSDDEGFVNYQLNGNAISAGSYVLKALENGVEKKMIVIKAE